ncbi:MAG: GNAT family N-acetyltransferase [Gammaproteobacteria bacterium]|jgi:acyl-coenzyme A synthetase/AMP-(fatty) acid ligase/acyl carrier protein|nr:GNAT family N-acetyltransferase [Gammaproteobacteria bacterium]
MSLLLLNTLGAITDVRQGETWTPDRLRAEIARRRAAMAETGVEAGTRVVLAHGGTPAFFGDLFAAWSLGAAAVCLNPTLTRPELANIAAFVEPAAVLVSAGTVSPPTDGLPVPVLDAGTGPAVESLPAGDSLAPDDPAVILFTSGTTGEPKGVVHTAGTLSARVRLNREHIEPEVLARTLCVLPTHFGHGLIGNCLTPLLAGGHLHLWPGPGPQGAPRLGEVLVEHAISFMSSVPSFWKLVLKTARPPARPVLQRVHIGSAPLSAELWEEVMAWAGTQRVCNLYGITETANWAAGACGEAVTPEDGLIGTMWGGEAAVMGTDGVRRTVGEGEILLRTPSLMTGYFRRPDLTEAVLRDGWYHTGDWGRLDESGTLRLLGRTKTEINRAGMKILPEEIDLLLERHPSVLEACTFGMPDPVKGESVAVALRRSDESLDGQVLRTWCRERIREECIPERWFMVPEIPKTDRGKINRAKVRDFCLARTKPQAADATDKPKRTWKPGDPLELTTPRFLLRSLTEDDVTDAYVAWWNDAEIQRGLGRQPRGWDRDKALGQLARNDNKTRFQLGIFSKADGRLIGFYALNFNFHMKSVKTDIVIGDKAFWGAGVVLEIRDRMLPIFFRQFKMHKVRGEVVGRNFPAIFNYRSQGFACEGIRREEYIGPDGDRVDLYHFGLLRAEWEARQKGEADTATGPARLADARRLLADALGIPLAELPGDATLGQPKAWDSLGHMRLMLALEERLGRALHPSVIAALASIEDIATILADGTLPAHRLASW